MCLVYLTSLVSPTCYMVVYTADLEADRPVTPPTSPGGTKQYEDEIPEPLPQLVRLPYNSTETPQPPA
jgi:hypothetical protein